MQELLYVCYFPDVAACHISCRVYRLLVPCCFLPAEFGGSQSSVSLSFSSLAAIVTSTDHLLATERYSCFHDGGFEQGLYWVPVIRFDEMKVLLGPLGDFPKTESSLSISQSVSPALVHLHVQNSLSNKTKALMQRTLNTHLQYYLL